MLQLIQNLKDGYTLLEELPVPVPSKGQVLIKSKYSLVSLGTEKMLVEFGKANLIQKARQQPEKVKQVLDKIKSDGLIPTLEAVFNKLDTPLPLGYCNAGEVIAVGEGVSEFKIGDRVASNGHHAEYVCIPQNLCAHIPSNVSYQEASFTVIGAIGLQGIRLLNPTMGETIVVVGMGLIGMLTAQLLKANGCSVIGIDVDDTKINLANELGINTFNPSKGDVVKHIENLTRHGSDGVIITASNKSDEIISQAARMCRKRGRIVLIGVIGLQLNRSEFYEKELTFQVSCSYGPGRYDENYEQKGNDYPLPYVRWTEKRNFETILKCIENKSIDVNKLITEVVDLKNYNDIYGSIGKSNSIASLLKYEDNVPLATKIKVSNETHHTKGKIAIVGAGNFTKMTMLPNMKNAPIKYIVSKGGLSAKALAAKHKVEYSSTDYSDALNDDEVSLIMITTRHNLHATMTVEALQKGKNVFVEKPLALTFDEIDNIIEAQNKYGGSVIVGFNRRFSPHIQKIKNVLPSSSPKNMIANMNAGFIADNVWIHDMQSGGGRIIGEACHYIDLLTYLSGSKVKKICMNALGINPKENTDNASILLQFENGDNGVINYFSNGNKAYSKERLEIYFDEKTIIMDNFRKTEAYGIKGFSTFKTSQDKGHSAQFSAVIDMVLHGKNTPIPLEEIINVSKASIAAVKSLQLGQWISIS